MNVCVENAHLFGPFAILRTRTPFLILSPQMCLLATVSPTVYNYDESVSTILFATRCMAVRNYARINTQADFNIVKPEPEESTMSACCASGAGCMPAFALCCSLAVTVDV